MVMIKVSSMILSSACCFLLLILSANSSLITESFIHCLSEHQFPSNISVLSVAYCSTNASYQSILESSIANLRFLSSANPKPIAIITPLDYSHVQTTVTCCRRNGLQMRIRSGGHDFEGLSSRSQVPFVILDLRNLRSININIEDESAWVESGATIGELCYAVAERSFIHGFPVGAVPDVGVGGHFSGGGVGYLARKYGLAADNVIDALIVDINGRILDSESMGSDLFWAIRGGGGGSFGVTLAWKIRLVHVPPVVTVFKLTKTFEQGAIDFIHKWQYVLPKMGEDLSFYTILSRFGAMSTLRAHFSSLFLGRVDTLLKLMEQIFPEFQLRKEDCIEMSWIESVLYLSDYPGEHSIQVLANRSYTPFTTHLKLKSDLVGHPLPYDAVEELWKWGSEVDFPTIVFQPYGGVMERISESQIPFPHRNGVVYELLYMLTWAQDRDGESEKCINQVRRLYEQMTPYVPSSPRCAYVNSRDLDLGTNGVRGTTYSKAKAWGSRYFKSNFKKLAIVKGKVDPTNFFYHEQSIPPLVSSPGGSKCRDSFSFLNQCHFQLLQSKMAS